MTWLKAQLTNILAVLLGICLLAGATLYVKLERSEKATAEATTAVVQEKTAALVCQGNVQHLEDKVRDQNKAAEDTAKAGQDAEQAAAKRAAKELAKPLPTNRATGVAALNAWLDSK